MYHCCPRRLALVGTALAVGVAGTGVQAQSAWEFSVTPYGWLAGLDGDLGALPGFPSQDVSLSFGDILDDLDYGVFLFASARNGPWALFLDGSAVQTTSTEQIGGAAVDSIEVQSRTSNLAFALGRSVASSETHNIEAYVGLRAWWLDNEFTVNTQPGTGLGTVRAGSDANWVDPLVGLAGQYAASDRWMLFGSAEIGGFGVGADLEWSLTAGAIYSVNDLFGLTFGWRYLAVDYDNDGIVFDVSQSGPLIGATFRF